MLLSWPDHSPIPDSRTLAVASETGDEEMVQLMITQVNPNLRWGDSYLYPYPRWEESIVNNNYVVVLAQTRVKVQPKPCTLQPTPYTTLHPLCTDPSLGGVWP